MKNAFLSFDSLVHETDTIEINAVEHEQTHLSVLKSCFLKTHTKTKLN